MGKDEIRDRDEGGTVGNCHEEGLEILGLSKSNGISMNQREGMGLTDDKDGVGRDETNLINPEKVSIFAEKKERTDLLTHLGHDD